MGLKTESTFKITGWKEDLIGDLDGGRGLKRAHLAKSYVGDFAGLGVVEYLIAYRADGTAAFVGFESVTGELGGKAGGFIFEHRGEVREGVVESIWTIVPRSGHGELAEISGRVEFKAGHQDEYPITIEHAG